IQVSVAENGKLAIELYQQAIADGQPFDGILMDCQMPVMDGYEATEYIRQQINDQDIPIIAMTANVMERDKEKALGCGMSDIIAKPIDVGSMFATLANWVSPSRPVAFVDPISHQEESVGSADESEDNSAFNAALSKVEGLDITLGLIRANNNHQLYIKLLHRFVEAYSDENTLTAELSSSTQQRYLHTLKGVAGNLGAKQLHTLCENLEAQPDDTDLKDKVISTSLELSQSLTEAFSQIEGSKDSAVNSSTKSEDRPEQQQQSTADQQLYRQLLDATVNDDTDALTIILNIEDGAKIGLSPSEFKRLEVSLEEFDFDKATEILKGSNLSD
ncbi:response regulator, partial [Vibrio splendidus]